MSDLRTMPSDRTRNVGTVMTNLDHSIDRELAEQLATPDTFGEYAAWEFHGSALWHEDERFHCEIWRYHQHVDTISAPSLEELMELASEKWGAA